jgi:hypothetical protein
MCYQRSFRSSGSRGRFHRCSIRALEWSRRDCDITYRWAWNVVCTKWRSATELAVTCVDASVDDVYSTSASGRGVINVSRRILVSVRDSTKSIWSTILRCDSWRVDLGVFLNVGNLIRQRSVSHPTIVSSISNNEIKTNLSKLETADTWPECQTPQ